MILLRRGAAMRYTTKQVSDITGVTTRTLRYYDEIGLLKPYDINISGYRLYSEQEIAGLYIVLAYKEVGYNLKEIKQISNLSKQEQLTKLYSAAERLHKKKDRISILIKYVEDIINKEKTF